MDLFKNPSLFNRDCWLKMLCLSLFVLFSFSWSYADGSRDLYPSGTTGGRAFLYSNSYTGTSGSTMGSWPFKTLGTHYAYVKAGETIHAASSAQGIGNGIIRLTAPDRTTVYETTSSSTTGRIAARKNELAGPSETGTVSGDKYSTFNRVATASQEGIWKIEFLPTGSTTSSSTPSVTSIGGNDNWTQNVSSELISAWDVSVRNAAGSAWITGRVYTNVMNLHISSSQNTSGYRGVSYVLTKDGYIYKVDNNGNNGVGFTFFVNNNGFLKDGTSEPSYKSLDISSGISSKVHSPLVADGGGQITHKIFYTTPSADLPHTATGAVPGANTWLKNIPQSPSVSDLKLQGVDGTEAFSQKGGYVKFNSNAQGRYTIEIEAGEGVTTPFAKRVLTGVSVAGSNSVLWDGKDGAGVSLSNGVYPLKVSVELQGAEVHFPFIDMEINPNGLRLELTNGPNPSSNDRFKVYWDDSEVSYTSQNNSTTNGRGKASTPRNTIVDGSLSGPTGTGGHMWGQQNNNTSPLSSSDLSWGFGNEKSIDTWTYIKGDKVSITPKATIQVADLKISSISHNKTNTAVKVDDKVTFTVKVKNGESGDGNSDVTGAPFTFTLPTGFIPDPDETVVFASGNAACGSEAIALTYNSTTRKYSSTLNLPNGCEVTYTIPSKVTSTSISGPNTAEATILRPKDVTDPDATNPDPNTPPTDPYFECNPSGGAVTCNNIKNTPIMVAPRSDLAVTKSISNNKPAIGDNVTFTVSVVNNGPDVATAVEVTDKLPSGYTVVSATPSQGSYSATTGVWVIGSLSNGASVILTVIGTVQPSSGIPNEYRNTATISNSGSDDPDPSNNTGTAEPLIPSLQFTKEGELSTDGNTITYIFTVTNNGNVTMSGIAVSDPKITGAITLTTTTLAPGASTTGTATYTLTQAEKDAGEVVNKATVTGTPPTTDPSNPATPITPVPSSPDPSNPGGPGSPENPTVVDVPANPSLTLAKTGVLSADGNTVTYTFTVTNNGNVTMSGIAVSDPKITGAITLTTTTLAPGASTTGTATYTLTQAEKDAGKVVNKATVTGTPPTTDPSNPATPITPVPSSPDPSNPGGPGSPENPTVVDVPANPSLTLAKTGVLSADGNTVTYTFTVTNSGNVTMSGIAVSDPKITGAITLTTTTLAPGATATGTATYTLTQAEKDAGEVVNKATVTGTPPTTDPSNPATPITPVPSSPNPSNPGGPGSPENPTVVDVPANPSLTLAKTGVLSADGNTVTYTFTVTNNGNVTMSDIAVSDPKITGAITLTTTTLAPGATATGTATYTLMQAEKDAGEVVNKATVTGTPPTTDPSNPATPITPVPSSPDPSNPGGPGSPENPTVVDVPANPSLTLAKTGVLSTDGNTVTYTFTVTNNGNVTMSGIAVSDPKITGAITLTTTTLAPGASTTGTATYTLTQAEKDAGEVVNKATVTGTPPTTDPSNPATPITPVPSSPDPSNPGGPGSPENPTVVDVPANPSLTLAKTGVLSADGNTVTYIFTVTNNGNVTMSGIAVSDPKITGAITLTTTTLAPGASTTGTATYTLTQAEKDAGKVVNKATVTGTPPTTDPSNPATPITPVPSSPDPSNPGGPGSPENPTVVDVPANPSLTLAKTGVLSADGNTVTYTFTVTNNGNVTMSGIAVSDPKITGAITLTTTTLAPGASTTGTATYTLTQAEKDAGKVVNKATVTGTPPTTDPSNPATPITPVPSSPDPSNPGGPGSPENPTVVDVPANPSLTLAKTGVLSADGNTVTYTFTVTNNGNVTMSGIAVSDPKITGAITLTTTTLAPGASTTGTATYTLTQAEKDAGEVMNKATVTGTPPTTDPSNPATPITPVPSSPDPSNPGGPGSPENPTVVDVPANPSLTLAKTGVLSADGNTVTYTFTVTNNGNVTMSGIAVSDPKITGAITLTTTTLAPGASTTGTATYTLTQAEKDAGKVVNKATVTGTPPTTDPSNPATPITPVPSSPDPSNPGGPGSPENPTVVDVPANPSLAFSKDGSLSADGNTITYTFKVSNTGNVTIDNIKITDAKLPSGVTLDKIKLAPGESAVGTAIYTLTQADKDAGLVENNATVTGTPPGSTTNIPNVPSVDPTPKDPSDPTTVVDFPMNPSISIVKTAVSTSGYRHAGDKIAYTIKVTNTGNVTLYNIAVTDDNADVKNVGTISKLDVGQEIILQAEHTITQADMIKGFVSNIAKAEGKDPKDNPVTGESTSGNTPKPGDPTDPNCADCTVTPLPWVPIEAVVDTPPAINGKDGGKTPSVIENDKLNNKPVDPKDIVVTVEKPADPKTPGAPVPTLDHNTGIVTVDPETPAGSYEITYKICEVLNPSNCSTTTVTIVVEPAPIEAVVDTPPAINGKDGGTTPNVLDNDKLNNKPVDPKDIVVTVEKPADPKTPGAPVPTLDPNTGIVTVDPETPAGSYEITYKICEVLNPSNCSTTTVTIVVEPAPIEAVVDTPPAINGKDGGTTPNVLDNDKLNNKPVDPKDVVVTVEKPADPKTPGAPVPTLDPNTGIVTVDPETPAGSYEITYKICEVLNPSNCSTTTVTIVVEPAPIEAVVDTPPAINGKDGGTTPNVLDNDKLNNKPVDPKDVVVTVEKPADPKTPGAPVPTLDPNTGIVTVDPETPAGSYEITYKICEVLNPSNCSTTTVTIVVEPAPIEAVVDTPPAINGKDGGTTPNVLDNDKLNNKPVDPKDVVVTVEKPADPKTPGAPVPTLDPNTGIVTVDPETPAGSYEITYKICEVLNPSNCSTTTVTIVVEPAPIEAVVDTPPAINGKDGGTTPNVLDNDKLNNKPVDPKDVVVTVEKPADPKTPGAPVPTLDPNTGIVTVDPETPAGSYEITYKICEVLNPSNCSTTTVTIVVEPAPIKAENDTPPAINGKDGGKTPSVVENDKLNNKPVDPKDIVVTVEKPADPKTPGAPVPTLDPKTGVVTVDPETPAGEYEITYKICEVLNPNNCSTATITIKVTAPEIKAVQDEYGPYNGKDGGETASVFENDLLNKVKLNPNDIELTAGVPVNSAGEEVHGLIMNKNGKINVQKETAAGKYYYPYTISEKLNPSNKDNTVAIVTVIAAPISAENDRYNVNGKNGGTTPTVLTNDKLNNKTIDPKEITLTPGNPVDSNGKPTSVVKMNTDGTITVAPNTPQGKYEYPYTICEVLNPTSCKTAVAIVEIQPAPIVASDDSYKVEWSREGVTTASVLPNDKYNGKAIDLDEVTLQPGVSSNPGLSMNPDGTINIAPSTRPGTYTYPYTICEVLNPTNCSTAVATIVIEATNVFIPNTFTPNGDGVNDKFEIVGIENFDRVSLTIVNRWGNEVYRNDSYKNEWNGSGLNEGTYYYIVTLHKGTTETVHKGWVLIKTR